MAQRRTPTGAGKNSGTGAIYIADATQYPTARVFDEVPNRTNRLDNVDEFEFSLTTSSSGEVKSFVARANGHVTGITVKNGSTAADGTNGWLLEVANESRSDADLGSFGLGTGTNAGTGLNNGNIAANATVYQSNGKLLTDTTAYFSTGDVITVDATEDGSAGAADIIVHLNYGSQGYEA